MWQADRELGAGARFALDRDCPSVLLGHDVVADRQAETGPFAGRLRRKERLEQLVSDLGRDAGAVVAHRDRDRLILSARRHRKGRAERAVAAVAGSLGSRVETVAE